MAMLGEKGLWRKIMPDMSLSIRGGGILPLGKYRNVQIFWQLAAICEKYDCTLDTPLGELPEEALNDILNGTNERLNLRTETLSTSNYFLTFDGLVKYIEMQQDDTATSAPRSGRGSFSRGLCVPNVAAPDSTARRSTSGSTARTSLNCRRWTSVSCATGLRTCTITSRPRSGKSRAKSSRKSAQG